jgi:hypothetical protein
MVTDLVAARAWVEHRFGSPAVRLNRQHAALLRPQTRRPSRWRRHLADDPGR